MQKIKQLFRKDYLGEDVNTIRTYQHAKWNPQSEYVVNQVVNLQTSNRALILGNGPSRQEINLDVVKRNTAGLQGRLKLQTYGCNAIYRDFEPNFLIATGTEIIKEIADSKYCDNHVVYAPSNEIVNYQDKFYLIPQDPKWDAGSLAAYIAAFDGHTKIFLAGFDGNDSANINYNIYAGTNGYPEPQDTIAEDFWIKSMTRVFKTYPDVDFARIVPTENFRTPEAWKYCLNFRNISVRQFVIEADL